MARDNLSRKSRPLIHSYMEQIVLKSNVPRLGLKMPKRKHSSQGENIPF